MGLVKSKCPYCGVTDKEPKRKVGNKNKYHIKKRRDWYGESCEDRAKNILRKHGTLD